MGERSNFALLPAAVRAMKQLLEWKVDADFRDCRRAQSPTRDRRRGTRILRLQPNHLRAPHYLCLRRKAAIPRELPEMLAREKVFVSVRGSSIRVTPHVYNSAEPTLICQRRLIRTACAQIAR